MDSLAFLYTLFFHAFPADRALASKLPPPLSLSLSLSLIHGDVRPPRPQDGPDRVQLVDGLFSRDLEDPDVPRPEAPSVLLVRLASCPLLGRRASVEREELGPRRGGGGGDAADGEEGLVQGLVGGEGDKRVERRGREGGWWGWAAAGESGARRGGEEEEAGSIA